MTCSSQTLRSVSFVAWAAAAFSLVAILMINIGGVSFPIDPVKTRSKLGHPGLEILEWYLNGQGNVSIANYYHYRLYLNRLCAVNPSHQRGLGSCYGGAHLGRFFLSEGDPDYFVRMEDPFDPVVNKVDFATPTFLYGLSASFLGFALLGLPFAIIGADSMPVSRWHSKLSMFCAGAMLLSTILLTISSFTFRHITKKLAEKMESVPQVTHVWRGHMPFRLTWAALFFTAVSTIGLAWTAWCARCALRKVEKRVAEKEKQLREYAWDEW